jgi:hypothetical protein
MHVNATANGAHLGARINLSWPSIQVSWVLRVHRWNPSLSENPIPAFGVKRKACAPAQGRPCCLIIDQPKTCEVNSRETQSLWN